MEIYQLRGFCEIAREGSFTRAADKLFLTQPAISLQLKALEEELGESLFERRRGGVRLTQAGQVLYGHARQVLAQLSQAREEISSLREVLKGRLAIGTSDTNCTYVLPEVLRRFKERHPLVELDIRNKMSPEVVRLVQDGEVDFGLATLPIKHRDLVAEELFSRQDVLICPPEHPLAGKRQVRLQDLVTQPLLVLEQGSTTRRLLEEAFHQAGLVLRPGMNLGSIEVLKRFVAIGLGIALVPEVAVAEEVATRQLAAVRVRGLAPRAVGLVERRGRRRSPAAAAFVELLREQLATSGPAKRPGA